MEPSGTQSPRSFKLHGSQATKSPERKRNQNLVEDENEKLSQSLSELLQIGKSTDKDKDQDIVVNESEKKSDREQHSPPLQDTLMSFSCSLSVSPTSSASEDKPPPPGLGTTSTRLTSFTLQQPKTREELKLPSYGGFMNKYDQELVCKIHISQLRCAHPLIEDFYFEAMKRRDNALVKNGGSGEKGLNFLPLPPLTEKKKRVLQHALGLKDKKIEDQVSVGQSTHVSAPVSNSTTPSKQTRTKLGIASSASSKAPRQRMVLNKGVNEENSVTSPLSDILGVQGVIEECFRAVLALEDQHLIAIEQRVDLTALDQNRLQDLRQKAEVVIVDRLMPLLGQGLLYAKGQSLLARALKLGLTPVTPMLLDTLLEHCLLPDHVTGGDNSLDDHLIKTVFTALVPLLATLSMTDLLSPVFGEQRPYLIATHLVSTRKKTSLIALICIILSRCELHKHTTTNEEEPSLAYTLHMVDLYNQHLRTRLLRLFPPDQNQKQSLQLAIQSPDEADVTSHDYYVWQLLALLALNIPDSSKPEMVMTLREKILSIVEGTGDEDEGSGSLSRLRHLNIFLGALGLDSDQLR